MFKQNTLATISHANFLRLGMGTLSPRKPQSSEMSMEFEGSEAGRMNVSQIRSFWEFVLSKKENSSRAEELPGRPQSKHQLEKVSEWEVGEI